MAGWLCWLGLPVPRWDDGAYKSPGAEWVQHGRMTVPCSKGFVPQAEEIFAAYPPLYQIEVGAWYKLFGVSLRSTLAFSFAVHLLGVLGVMAVAERLVRTASGPLPLLGGRVPLAAVIVVAVGLIHLANLSRFDRLEEAALLCMWLEVLTVHGLATRPGWRRALASGLLLALTGLTAPWAGVLGVLIITVRALFTAIQAPAAQRRATWRAMTAHLAVAAAATLALVGVWFAIMEYFWPGAVVGQFGATFLYLKRTQVAVGGWQKLMGLGGTLRDNRLQLPAAVAALALFAAGVRRIGWRRVALLGWALYLGAVMGMLLLAVVRPAAYFYFGTTLILLLPCLAWALAEGFSGNAAAAPGSSPEWAVRRNTRGRLLAAALICSVAVAGMESCLWAMAPGWLPENQRPDRVFAELRNSIPSGQAVATTAVHWLAFQGRNPWRELLFAPPRRKKRSSASGWCCPVTCNRRISSTASSWSTPCRWALRPCRVTAIPCGIAGSRRLGIAAGRSHPRLSPKRRAGTLPRRLANRGTSGRSPCEGHPRCSRACASGWYPRRDANHPGRPYFQAAFGRSGGKDEEKSGRGPVLLPRPNSFREVAGFSNPKNLTKSPVDLLLFQRHDVKTLAMQARLAARLADGIFFLSNMKDYRMKSFASKMRRFLVSEDGPTAVEYAVMLALIVIVCLAAIGTIGTNASATFNKIATSV